MIWKLFHACMHVHVHDSHMVDDGARHTSGKTESCLHYPYVYDITYAKHNTYSRNICISDNARAHPATNLQCEPREKKRPYFWSHNPGICICVVPTSKHCETPAFMLALIAGHIAHTWTSVRDNRLIVDVCWQTHDHICMRQWLTFELWNVINHGRYHRADTCQSHRFQAVLD